MGQIDDARLLCVVSKRHIFIWQNKFTDAWLFSLPVGESVHVVCFFGIGKQPEVHHNAGFESTLKFRILRFIWLNIFW